MLFHRSNDALKPPAVQTHQRLSSFNGVPPHALEALGAGLAHAAAGPGDRWGPGFSKLVAIQRHRHIGYQ